ncbi:MAG: transporter substrate-binding domain-containing protein, partial [Eggerthellaceae bacterium]|nr:transporter substrate-binding domain-containing protein [Eggerthellaceae bacterium]
NPPALSAPSIIEEGVLTVGIKTDSTTAPFSVVGADGSVAGIDVDLAALVADELGLTVRYVAVPDDSAALDGRCDIVMSCEEPSESLAVVGDYAQNAIGFFGVTGSAGSDTASLDGHTVGCQEGSVSQYLLGRSNLNMPQFFFSNLNEAFDALEAGQVEFVVCDAYSGAYLSAIKGDMGIIGIFEAPKAVGIGVAASTEVLKASVESALATVCTDGTFDIVRGLWLAGMPPLTESNLISGLVLGEDDGSAASASGESVVAGGQNGADAGSNAASISGESSSSGGYDSGYSDYSSYDSGYDYGYSEDSGYSEDAGYTEDSGGYAEESGAEDGSEG